MIEQPYYKSEQSPPALLSRLIKAIFNQRRSVLFCCLVATRVVEAAPDTQGKQGDPSSWHSLEYFASGGLAALNADHAYAAGLTGKGIKLGILDTLVYAKHPAFAKGQVTNLITSGTRLITNYGEPHKKKGDAFYYGENFVPGRLLDHGTSVASIAGASRDGKEMHGIAFNADILAAQVDDSGETGNVLGNDGAVFGAGWKALIASGARVINASWGIGPVIDLADPPDGSKPFFTLEQARKQYEDMTRILGTPDGGAYQGAMDAARSGILNVFAAGNSLSLNEPDAIAGLPYFVPDLAKNWLIVASVDVDGENANQLSDFSTRCGYAASFCVTAPGNEIYSATVAYKNPTDTNNHNDEYYPAYGSLSGTSMSAPLVAGSAALLMERFPYMTGDQIATVLKTTATDLGKPGIDEEFGWGLINLEKAINGPAMFVSELDIPEEFRIPKGDEPPNDMDFYADHFVANLPGVNAIVDKGKPTERVCDTARCGLDVWSNDISGHGGLIKTGLGTLVLTGNNTYSGETSVAEGGLVVTGGSVSDFVVSYGATLSGNGTVGSLQAVSGAIIAPGAAGDMLTATKYIMLNAQARYQVEVDSQGHSTRLYTPGDAMIGKALVDVKLARTNLLSNTHSAGGITNQTYTILSADDGVSGKFADALNLSPFLTSILSYQPTEVMLNFERNGVSLASVAQTQNSRAVAMAIDRLSAGHPVLESLLTMSTQEGAQQAFRWLTGQIHADIAAALVNDSRYLRETLNYRLRQAEGQTALQQETVDNNNGVWVQMLGEKNHASGNDNANGYHTSTYGVLLGLDNRLSNSARIGAALGYTRTSLKGGQSSSADSNNTHLALYGSKQWGAFTWRTEGIFTWHSIDTKRSVNYDVHSDHATAGYRGRTGQIFTELGYGRQAQKLSLEPFVNLAYVDFQNGRMSENAGAAALQGNKRHTKATVSTLGLRTGYEWQIGSNHLGLNSELGWQHQYGKTARDAELSFKGSQTPFVVNSVSTSRDGAVIKVGADLAISKNAAVSLNYSGLVSQNQQDNSITAGFNFRF